ncbi:uncharacterized protein LOC119164465 isoform X1 [Rhipicephalus microplus]|uniref:uncharacterized protein LOC119164465 isoform X1 n=1 Tax=Rhipicephalus microplus TaxID=6941 RepID=UPI003F6BFF42
MAAPLIIMLLSMLMDEAEHDRGSEKRNDAGEADRRDDNDGARTQEIQSEEVICEVDSFNVASPPESSCPTPVNDEIGLLLPKREPEEIVCAVDCTDGYFPTHIDSSDSNVEPYSPKSEMEEPGIRTEGPYGPPLFGHPGNVATTGPNSSGFVNCWWDSSGTNSNVPVTGPLPGNAPEPNSSGSLRCWWDPSIVNKAKDKAKSASVPVPVFCCEMCGDCFASVEHLNRHRLSTHTARPQGRHQCALCPYSSNRRHDVDAHERTHNGVKPFVCHLCHKGFVQRSQLHVHLKSHSGERPHECMECGKRFVLLSHLDYHRNNVHGNAEKSHVCPQCGRGFVRRAVLGRHMLSHEAEKPHVCSVCGRTFSRLDNAKTHLRRKHPDSGGDIYTTPVGNPLEDVPRYGALNEGRGDRSSALYEGASSNILGVAGVVETPHSDILHTLSKP